MYYIILRYLDYILKNTHERILTLDVARQTKESFDSFFSLHDVNFIPHHATVTRHLPQALFTHSAWEITRITLQAQVVINTIHTCR